MSQTQFPINVLELLLTNPRFSLFLLKLNDQLIKNNKWLTSLKNIAKNFLFKNNINEKDFSNFIKLIEYKTDEVNFLKEFEKQLTFNFDYSYKKIDFIKIIEISSFKEAKEYLKKNNYPPEILIMYIKRTFDWQIIYNNIDINNNIKYNLLGIIYSNYKSFDLFIFIKKNNNEDNEKIELKIIRDNLIKEKGKIENIISTTMISSNNLSKNEILGLVGLENIGSTCFMNSVLQCVKNLYQITHYFLTEEENHNNFTKCYKNLLINLCKGKSSVFSPKKFKELIGKKDKDFKDYTPNDSKEFLMALLSSLGEENIISNPKIYFNEDDKIFEKALRKVLFSKISLYFNFSKKIIVECKYCKRYSKNFQFYNILDLPIITENGNQICSLNDAIKISQENKNGICNCGYNMQTQLSIYTLPKILIIYLQRSNFIEHSTHFVDFKPEFSFDEISLDDFNDKYKGYLYELVGVINHYGSQYGGHNYSYCKNFFNDQWYEYNDEKVYPIDKDKICTKYGFLLFYELKNATEKVVKTKQILEALNKYY